MAVRVTVQLPGAPGARPRYDRHVAAGVDEPPQVRHLADVLHGGAPEAAEELWRRHPGCAVLAVPGPDGSVHIRFRGGALTIRLADAVPNAAPSAAPSAAPATAPATAPDATPTAAALAGSLVHALLVAGGAPTERIR
ncbi:hypothetical protein ACIQF6_24310 [Kitasatospora sp. NPDC092948]|uniref:hypothetical protein n=1 Tax=Kitasatospora sp. NPDC092948 TaxID=3364088 RepID=UPI003815E73C